MSRCFEHDYESVFCRNCGGYCGEACVNCSNMWDGGETAVATMEWCHCDNQVFDFGFEEPASKEVRPTQRAADECRLGGIHIWRDIITEGSFDLCIKCGARR